MQEMPLLKLDLLQLIPGNSVKRQNKNHLVFDHKILQQFKKDINLLKQKYHHLQSSTCLSNANIDISALSHDMVHLQCDISFIEQALKAQMVRCKQFFQFSSTIKQSDYNDLQTIAALSQEIISKVKAINKRLSQSGKASICKKMNYYAAATHGDVRTKLKQLQLQLKRNQSQIIPISWI